MMDSIEIEELKDRIKLLEDKIKKSEILDIKLFNSIAEMIRTTTALLNKFSKKKNEV